MGTKKQVHDETTLGETDGALAPEGAEDNQDAATQDAGPHDDDTPPPSGSSTAHDSPDVIGVVRPGDSDGLAYLVVRSLGRGDGGVYDEACADVVRARQQDWDLEPTGVVSGATWGLLLRRLAAGDMGHEVLIARSLLSLLGCVASVNSVFDEELAKAVAKYQKDAGLDKVVESAGDIDTVTWIALIEEAGNV
jgi:hypothetical protein